MLKINVVVHKNGAMDVDHDSNESSQQHIELWSHPYKVNVTWVSSLVKHNQMSIHFTCIFLSWSMWMKEWLWRYIICQMVTMSCTVSLTFLLSGEMHSSYRNDGGAATCRWWRWSGWQPFCACRAQTHWFLCLVIDGASLSAQTAEKSSWQAEARRVEGLHFVIMVIWELKLSRCLPSRAAGTWSQLPEISACATASTFVWPQTGPGECVYEVSKIYIFLKLFLLDKAFRIMRNKFSHVFPNFWLACTVLSNT